MARFHGYDTIERISETRGAFYFRARTIEDGRPVIIKSLKTSSPTPTEMARFNQEAEAIRAFDSRGVVKTLDVITDDAQVALVLEDDRADTLKSLIDPDRPFKPGDFLPKAMDLALILGEFHEKGVIHKAVKPAHVRVNRDTGRVTLTDFGIAATLTRENDDMYNKEVMDGTRVYMSPEQSGRMSHTVDHRSDLYSLGIKKGDERGQRDERGQGRKGGTKGDRPIIHK